MSCACRSLGISTPSSTWNYLSTMLTMNMWQQSSHHRIDCSVVKNKLGLCTLLNQSIPFWHMIQGKNVSIGEHRQVFPQFSYTKQNHDMLVTYCNHLQQSYTISSLQMWRKGKFRIFQLKDYFLWCVRVDQH